MNPLNTEKRQERKSSKHRVKTESRRDRDHDLRRDGGGGGGGSEHFRPHRQHHHHSYRDGERQERRKSNYPSCYEKNNRNRGNFRTSENTHWNRHDGRRASNNRRGGESRFNSNSRRKFPVADHSYHHRFVEKRPEANRRKHYNYKPISPDYIRRYIKQEEVKSEPRDWEVDSDGNELSFHIAPPRCDIQCTERNPFRGEAVPRSPSPRGNARHRSYSRHRSRITDHSEKRSQKDQFPTTRRRSEYYRDSGSKARQYFDTSHDSQTLKAKKRQVQGRRGARNETYSPLESKVSDLWIPPKREFIADNTSTSTAEYFRPTSPAHYYNAMIESDYNTEQPAVRGQVDLKKVKRDLDELAGIQNLTREVGTTTTPDLENNYSHPSVDVNANAPKRKRQLETTFYKKKQDGHKSEISVETISSGEDFDVVVISENSITTIKNEQTSPADDQVEIKTEYSSGDYLPYSPRDSDGFSSENYTPYTPVCEFETEIGNQFAETNRSVYADLPRTPSTSGNTPMYSESDNQSGTTSFRLSTEEAGAGSELKKEKVWKSPPMLNLSTKSHSSRKKAHDYRNCEKCLPSTKDPRLTKKYSENYGNKPGRTSECIRKHPLTIPSDAKLSQESPSDPRLEHPSYKNKIPSPPSAIEKKKEEPAEPRKRHGQAQQTTPEDPNFQPKRRRQHVSTPGRSNELSYHGQGREVDRRVITNQYEKQGRNDSFERREKRKEDARSSDMGKRHEMQRENNGGVSPTTVKFMNLPEIDRERYSKYSPHIRRILLANPFERSEDAPNLCRDEPVNWTDEEILKQFPSAAIWGVEGFRKWLNIDPEKVKESEDKIMQTWSDGKGSTLEPISACRDLLILRAKQREEQNRRYMEWDMNIRKELGLELPHLSMMLPK